MNNDEIVLVELNRYQDMVQKVLDYIEKHQEVKEVQEIYEIVKDWCC